MDKLTVFLPCRKGSDRVKDKNTKPFTEDGKSLFDIKISQLLSVNEIDEILVSTNDDLIIDKIEHLNKDKLKYFKREDSLSSSITSTDSLIIHAGDIIANGTILWTHVTSPFINTNLYKNFINCYNDIIKDQEYDSLVTVTKLQKFIWNYHHPVNYKREIEKWPRTQTLPKYFEINSGAFIFTKDLCEKLNDRIGAKPFFYELNFPENFDIDWNEDYLTGQKLCQLFET